MPVLPVEPPDLHYLSALVTKDDGLTRPDISLTYFFFVKASFVFVCSQLLLGFVLLKMS